jgi:hypothetical protein
MKDEHNPEFLFQSVSEELLVMITSGKLDALLQAKKELKNRGLDENGEWHQDNWSINNN